LHLTDATGVPVTVELDWLQTGPQSWDIRVDTDAGAVTLEGGGRRLIHEGEILVDAVPAEYAGIYRRFVELAAAGSCDLDLSPLALVADAFLLGQRRIVAPFED
jgi:D-galactose 1-dehydrogenase